MVFGVVFHKNRGSIKKRVLGLARAGPSDIVGFFACQRSFFGSEKTRPELTKLEGVRNAVTGPDLKRVHAAAAAAAIDQTDDAQSANRFNAYAATLRILGYGMCASVASLIKLKSRYSYRGYSPMLVVRQL